MDFPEKNYQNEDKICPICLDEEKTVTYQSKCCYKWFCQYCIRWLKKDNCPMCRADLNYKYQVFGKFKIRGCREDCNRVLATATFNILEKDTGRDFKDYIIEKYKIEDDRIVTMIVCLGNRTIYDSSIMTDITTREATIYILLRGYGCCTFCWRYNY